MLVLSDYEKKKIILFLWIPYYLLHDRNLFDGKVTEELKYLPNTILLIQNVYLKFYMQLFLFLYFCKTACLCVLDIV